MAHPNVKRRKIAHTPSSDADDRDNDSFASFSDEEETPSYGASRARATNGDVRQKELGDSRGSGKSGTGSAPVTATKTKAANGEMAHSKPAQSRTKKPSSSMEQNMLASGTFKSNAFRMQVDELLGQIRPKSGKLQKAAEKALHALKNTIEQIPSTKSMALEEAERGLLKHKVAIPFPDPRPPKDAKYKFTYEKPVNINIVGSFALKTTPRSTDGIEVDMIVTIPAGVFEEKDFLNYRYFYKRAYYLACIANALKASHKQDYQLRFKLFRDDSLKPILVVSPLDPASSDQAPALRWQINIIPCVAQDQFASEKLGLQRNCIRSLDTSTENTSVTAALPTPFYNSSLRADMLMTSMLKLVHTAKKNCEDFTDTCLLGATWLRQRGFGSSVSNGGFGNFEWAAMLALCLQGGGPNNKPLLSNGYSSYQLFKALLQLFVVKDFSKQPLIIGLTNETPKSLHNSPVVWDGEHAHNLLYKMQQWSYKLLRYEAKTTLMVLGDQIHDGFEATFIQRIQEPLLRFDHVLQLPLESLLGPDRAADERKSFEKLNKILIQGLGDRVNQLSITTSASGSWTLGSSRPQVARTAQVTIGVIVNQSTVDRIVDHGPSAEHKAEAAAFRDFWGEKAELRRFKDGSILESLVWSSPSAGVPIVEQIVRHLLHRHISPEAANAIVVLGHSFAKYLRGGTDISSFAPVMESFKRLEHDIRSIDDLPLSIREIAPADSQLRYASVEFPASNKIAQRMRPADIVLQFEGSARWPDDLVAIQRTKIAFLLKLQDSLNSGVDSLTSRVGLENEGQEVLNQGFLDITYDQVTTFRLRIHHDREQTLFQHQLKDKSSDPKTREIAATGLAKYKRDNIKVPAHTQAIVRLCTRHAALSGAIRLTKRWFASHLLTHHIAEEIIELLVAHTFTRPWPYQAPTSVQSAFLRTLSWISRWDWRLDPLVVDLSDTNELQPATVQSITTRFEAWRKLDPSLNRIALFVATNLDPDGNTYSDGRPATVVAARMTALAKAACAEISSQQLALALPSLFSSPLADFDFALHLDRRACGGGDANAGPASGGAGFKNLELAALDDTDSLGHDPARDLLLELEEVFGSAVVFFRGGDAAVGAGRFALAGLWRPQTARRGWKVNLAYSTIPLAGPPAAAAGAGTEDDGGGEEEGEAQAAINKSAMLAEMVRIGGDLIEKVDVHGH
ncbi:Nrap protein [Dissoconium aciculare CBS 342.82]|uniref:U3 small nucleolar RNA-associated protein 22 n=1 Tax=Dissoconium aciculare CBS 342.82 TaxID=1314786 RepID=A0A6J3MDX3_9PEZI|nr:Nrap protein [Dissoconium aciculare CBS 342.82]KAF1825052.1 Nrap protein [Dissoconium aciculare CBS 342.82]